MTLLDPWFLLLGLPVVLTFLWRLLRPGGALPTAAAAPLAGLPRTLRQRCRPLPALLQVLAGLVLVVALARPVSREVLPWEQEGVDILLVLDISSSMREQDMGGGQQRIAAAVERAGEFIARRSRDRVGLLTFATFPDLLCPLTLDHESLGTFLAGVEALPQRRSIENSTGIGVALAKAVQLLGNQATESRVIVLLSDGENNVQALLPADAARLAADAGLRVHTIGIGTGERTGMGRRPLSFNSLQVIAETTGGSFFRAEFSADLAEVYDAIDALETVPLEDPRYRTTDGFAALLAAGLSLFALALLVEFLWIREVP